MDLIYLVIVVLGAAFLAKLAYVGYLLMFKPNELPDDLGAPVSGWGTGDQPSSDIKPPHGDT